MIAFHECDVRGITSRLRPSLKKIQLPGKVRLANRICPFTLESIEACSARKTAYRKVCPLTLESCGYVPEKPTRKHQSNSVFS